MALRILISGAGIAGPSAAFWFSRLGHQCTVVERGGEIRAGGQQIDLRLAGISVMNRMGIREEVMAHNVDEAGFRIVDRMGRVQMTMGRQEEGARVQKFTSEIEIMRGDLSRILYERTRDRVEYRFGVRVEDYEAPVDGNGKGVKVKLSDGTEGVYDLLIAADGGGSRIREMMIEKDPGFEDTSRVLDLYGAYFQTERRAEEKGEKLATACGVPGHKVMIMRWHAEKQGQAYLFTRTRGADEDMRRAMEGHELEKQKEAFARAFRGIGWRADRMIEDMRTADNFYAEELVQRRSNRWHSGPVVLLGDAAMCPAAVTGMGTTMAMTGAYVLAGEIARHGIPGGLQGYDKVMRPFVESWHDLPRGIWGPWWPGSAAGLRTLFAVLKVLKRTGMDKVVAWIRSKEKPVFKLPSYKELEDVEGK